MKKIYVTAILAFTINAFAQVNPTARNLPFYETFGTNTYTAMPTGFGTGVVSGAPVSSQTAAQASTISAAATLAPATAAQTNGGSYGYSVANDAKFYVQPHLSLRLFFNFITN